MNNFKSYSKLIKIKRVYSKLLRYLNIQHKYIDTNIKIYRYKYSNIDLNFKLKKTKYIKHVLCVIPIIYSIIILF